MPSQLYRWRCELLEAGEPGQIAANEVKQSSGAGAGPVVEILIGRVVVPTGADIDEAHLQRDRLRHAPSLS